MSFLSSIGLPEILAGVMVVALNAYALTGGADFGGGVWDLLARGPQRDAERALIAESIAPIWEANHVWLIVVVVMLFTAFPPAFATIGIVLHVPITLMLIGIVMRGTAFVFRSYGTRGARHRARWTLLFAVASTITPLLLGMIVGALASGTVGAASQAAPSAGFPAVYLSPWLATFPAVVGVLALALFAFLAAVYLAYTATDETFREAFRRRAIGAAIAVGVLALGAILVAAPQAPRVMQGIVRSSWALPLHVLTAIAAIVALVALVRRRYAIARIAAAAQVSLILWGWAFAQYPYLIPEQLTIHDAAAPRVTLKLLAIGLVVGAAILLPSLRYLFSLFGAGELRPADERAHGTE